MSDPKPYGEPASEPTSVDDVVGRANEGLADAEAAGDEAVAAPAPAENDAAVADHTSPDYEPTDDDYAAAGYVPSARTEYEAPTDSVAAPEAAHVEPATEVYAAPVSDTATSAYGDDAAAASVVAPAEPAYVAPEYVAPAYVASTAAPQPIFVQAPEAPHPRGNRGAAGGIGLLAAVVFGLLYLGAWLGFGAIAGDVTAENVGTTALAALATWSLWVPVVVFFLAFWLLGAIINRGRWGHWVIFGLLVGAAAYGGHLLGALFQAPFWTLTAREGAALVEGQLVAPLAIAAFVFGRELTIWFGAWVAARGKRVTELNIEAQREYERTLEAGPQLYQQ